MIELYLVIFVQRGCDDIIVRLLECVREREREREREDQRERDVVSS